MWYDREGESIDNKECRQSMKAAYKVVEALIAEEGRNGIPPERIVVGKRKTFSVFANGKIIGGSLQIF